MKYRKPSHKTLGSYLCLRYLLYYLYVFIIVCFQSDLPCSPPGDVPNPVIVSRSHSLQVDSLPSEPPGKSKAASDNNFALLFLFFGMFWSLSPVQRYEPPSTVLQASSVSDNPFNLFVTSTV